MRNAPRKAVINYKPTEKKQNLTTVIRALANKGHKHTCSNPSCRLVYEDPCFSPELNARCRPCKGMRRTWVDKNDGLTAWDPRPCCIDNVDLVTDPADLLRYQLAGPGPWFQCRTCKRAHGHNCTDTDLLTRPLTIHNPEGTS